MATLPKDIKKEFAPGKSSVAALGNVMPKDIPDYHGNVSFFGSETYKSAIEFLADRLGTTQGKLVRYALDAVYGREIARLLNQDSVIMDEYEVLGDAVHQEFLRGAVDDGRHR
jgi:hypothetical protein